MQPKDYKWRLNYFHIIYATHESAIHASLMRGGGGRRQLDKQGAIHATYIKTALALSCVHACRYVLWVYDGTTRPNINVTPSVNSHKSTTDSDTLHIKRETALDLCPRRCAHASSFDLRAWLDHCFGISPSSDSDSHTHTLSNEWFCRQFAPAW